MFRTETVAGLEGEVIDERLARCRRNGATKEEERIVKVLEKASSAAFRRHQQSILDFLPDAR